MSGPIDKSQIQILMGEYGVASGISLKDSSILHRVREFRRSLSRRMMALDKKGIRKKIPSERYHASRKIDGEFTVLVLEEDETFTINPYGTVRVGLPFMEEAKKRLQDSGAKRAMIAGELYYARSDKRPRVHDVVRIARKPEKKEDLELLRFAVFDIVEIDSPQPTGRYIDEWKTINDLFSGGRFVHPVDTKEVDGDDGVFNTFQKWVEEEGEEGLVARSDVGGMFKIKLRHTLDVAVVGFAEGTEDRQGMLHDALMAVMRDDGTFHILGRVGGGFTDEQRESFFSDFQDIAAESEYHEINADRVAYRMVRPECVFEISCLDLISENTRGRTMDRMVLNWNTERECYEIVRTMPLVSIISPIFIRIRDDKTTAPSDVGIKQITDLVDVPMADKNALDIVYPKSEVLERKVYTKVQKGGAMVRKLVLWKTNKETENEDFPAFVVYGTDFSPNRKVPLKRDIRVSNSKEQIETLMAGLEKKYFLKGWKPAEEA